MRQLKNMWLGLSTLAVAFIASSAAMAGTPNPGGTLPAPGVIGLVAGGVIAAIAVARLRK